jgi:DNA integrity scanning protein DisA with diadenylate cyclase activity
MYHDIHVAHLSFWNCNWLHPIPMVNQVYVYIYIDSAYVIWLNQHIMTTRKGILTIISTLKLLSKYLKKFHLKKIQSQRISIFVFYLYISWIFLHEMLESPTSQNENHLTIIFVKKKRSINYWWETRDSVALLNITVSCKKICFIARQ